jgi:hypothetical protein
MTIIHGNLNEPPPKSPLLTIGIIICIIIIIVGAYILVAGWQNWWPFNSVTNTPITPPTAATSAAESAKYTDTIDFTDATKFKLGYIITTTSGNALLYNTIDKKLYKCVESVVSTTPILYGGVSYSSFQIIYGLDNAPYIVDKSNGYKMKVLPTTNSTKYYSIRSNGNKIFALNVANNNLCAFPITGDFTITSTNINDTASGKVVTNVQLDPNIRFIAVSATSIFWVSNGILVRLVLSNGTYNYFTTIKNSDGSCNYNIDSGPNKYFVNYNCYSVVSCNTKTMALLAPITPITKAVRDGVNGATAAEKLLTSTASSFVSSAATIDASSEIVKMTKSIYYVLDNFTFVKSGLPENTIFFEPFENGVVYITEYVPETKVGTTVKPESKGSIGISAISISGIVATTLASITFEYPEASTKIIGLRTTTVAGTADTIIVTINVVTFTNNLYAISITSPKVLSSTNTVLTPSDPKFTLIASNVNGFMSA